MVFTVRLFEPRTSAFLGIRAALRQHSPHWRISFPSQQHQCGSVMLFERRHPAALSVVATRLLLLSCMATTPPIAVVTASNISFEFRPDSSLSCRRSNLIWLNPALRPPWRFLCGLALASSFCFAWAWVTSAAPQEVLLAASLEPSSAPESLRCLVITLVQDVFNNFHTPQTKNLLPPKQNQQEVKCS